MKYRNVHFTRVWMNFVLKNEENQSMIALLNEGECSMSVELPESIQFLHKIEIGLGAWAWGDRLVWNYGRGYTDDDIEAGFKVSLENGANLVDTAEIYGNGR